MSWFGRHSVEKLSVRATLEIDVMREVLRGKRPLRRPFVAAALSQPN